MKRLRDLARFIENNEQEQVISMLYQVYPNLNKNIIKYFLARHLYKDGIFDQFAFLDLQKCNVIEREISNDEVFNLIEYADFCCYKDIDCASFYKLKFDDITYFTTGSWRWPIVTTPINGKLVAIDGNNRLRQLRCYLSHIDVPKATSHTVYVLQQEKNTSPDSV